MTKDPVLQPEDQAELATAVQQAFASDTAVYPRGGGTSLDFGLPPRRQGLTLSLAGLNRVVDYPARDLTVTVEAGLTMRELAELLGQENQWLPVDVPQPGRATLGGVVATNFNGPRRYGLGALRDSVIGIRAVDGRGRAFQGGGRVVKNVAGYDFCKLLTGSLGTLAVITQLTLKLRPRPQRSVLMACRVPDPDQAERHLAALVDSQTAPTAIELLAGPAWDQDPALGAALQPAGSSGLLLVVGLEGTDSEVDWMVGQLADEWRRQGVGQPAVIRAREAEGLWGRLAEFPAQPAPLVIKASVVPSRTVPFIQQARQVDPNCSLQAHAGNGIVLVRFSEFPSEGLSRTLVARLQPAAAAAQGTVVVLSNPSGAEMTRQSVWDGSGAPLGLMASVKQQFDPKNLLNPDRFVYP